MHKLLLADDSVTIQRVVELTFSGEDVQVVAVGDGEQAITRIPIELPDIVLADIAMPKHSGYDVAAFVKGRADLSHIPVLLLAGAFEPVDENRAQMVRSDGVLVKPFEPKEVVARVLALIAGSRNQLPRPESAVPAMPAAESRHTNGDRIASPRPDDAVRSEAERADQGAERKSESKLDEYFERLDAAFAGLGDAGRHVSPRAGTDEDFDGRDVPTLESLLAASTEALPDEPERSAPAASPLFASPQPASPSGLLPQMPVLPSQPPESHDGGNLIAQMFAALFAAEQGEPVPPAAHHAVSLRPDVAVQESLVDEVTRRVIERLAPGAANEMVAQIVSEVAERLVREEIARIRSSVAARLSSTRDL